MAEFVRVKLDDRLVDCQVISFRGFVAAYNITGDTGIHLRPFFKEYGCDDYPYFITRLFKYHILEFAYENEPILRLLYNGTSHRLEWGDVILRYNSAVGDVIYRPMKQEDYEKAIVDDCIPQVIFKGEGG